MFSRLCCLCTVTADGPTAPSVSETKNVGGEDETKFSGEVDTHIHDPDVESMLFANAIPFFSQILLWMQAW